jgi:hypothetical protein
MLQFLQAAKLVLSLVPEIANIILMLEKTLPQAGIGTEKLTALRAILTAAYAGIDLVWGSIELIVKTLVGLWNEKGWPIEKELPPPALPE